MKPFKKPKSFRLPKQTLQKLRHFRYIDSGKQSSVFASPRRPQGDVVSRLFIWQEWITSECHLLDLLFAAKNVLPVFRSCYNYSIIRLLANLLKKLSQNPACTNLPVFDPFISLYTVLFPTWHTIFWDIWLPNWNRNYNHRFSLMVICYAQEKLFKERELMQSNLRSTRRWKNK